MRTSEYFIMFGTATISASIILGIVYTVKYFGINPILSVLITFGVFGIISTIAGLVIRRFE